MPFVKWSPEFSVGVDEIDSDHRKLLDLVNGLYDAVTYGSGRDELGKVLEGLAEYVHYHFAHEEDLFERTNYPGTERHRLQHRALTTTVAEIYEDYKSGSTDILPMQVLEFLKNWLYEHILGSDRAFGVYLNAHQHMLEAKAQPAPAF
jgi:hemerythrin-like metal-binding protein